MLGGWSKPESCCSAGCGGDWSKVRAVSVLKSNQAHRKSSLKTETLKPATHCSNSLLNPSSKQDVDQYYISCSAELSVQRHLSLEKEVSTARRNGSRKCRFLRNKQYMTVFSNFNQ